MAESAALLVDEVLPHQPIRQWVLSVPFPLWFLFAGQPKIMGKALSLNIHFHMLFLDGSYVREASSSSRFRWVTEPTSYEHKRLAHTIAYRLA